MEAIGAVDVFDFVTVVVDGGTVAGSAEFVLVSVELDLDVEDVDAVDDVGCTAVGHVHDGGGRQGGLDEGVSDGACIGGARDGVVLLASLAKTCAFVGGVVDAFNDASLAALGDGARSADGAGLLAIDVNRWVAAIASAVGAIDAVEGSSFAAFDADVFWQLGPGVKGIVELVLVSENAVRVGDGVRAVAAEKETKADVASEGLGGRYRGRCGGGSSGGGRARAAAAITAVEVLKSFAAHVLDVTSPVADVVSDDPSVDDFIASVGSSRQVCETVCRATRSLGLGHEGPEPQERQLEFHVHGSLREIVQKSGTISQQHLECENLAHSMLPASTGESHATIKES